ncbi:MAG: hypothetical protein JOZ98_19175 [Solirubrobacterales bacterium]|nr:hypothetical protein [Solirubrobacterales bacterium]MBV9797985.1 hypothetical protein [Solirubrobacterales bacterium]
MAYTTAEARQQLLDDLADATDRLAFGLACVAEAYEELDEQAADALEEQMFRPLQGAYGRARRAYADFAARYELPNRTFETPSPGTHTGDPRVYIERAVEATEDADQGIAELQDSMLPVEVGDTELRAGLSETRALIAELPARGRRLLQTFGR